MRKLWSFLAAYHCRFKPRTDSDSISVGSSLKPTVMTQYHCRFLAKTDSKDPNISVGWSYHCRAIIVSVDSLIEDHLCTEPANEYIQSCDIVAFNKICKLSWTLFVSRIMHPVSFTYFSLLWQSLLLFRYRPVVYYELCCFLTIYMAANWINSHNQ